MIDILESILHVIVEYGILLFEAAGVGILIWAGIKGIYQYVKKEPEMRLNLFTNMSIALTFKLGGEILKTVLLQDLSECLFVGFIVLLRATMTFLIQWEMKQEKRAENEQIEQ